MPAVILRNYKAELILSMFWAGSASWGERIVFNCSSCEIMVYDVVFAE